MRFIWCCNECKKLYEIECKAAEIDNAPHKGKCPDCGGELRRGLCPIPMTGPKTKGRMGNH
jgi:hypothetical protein